MSQKRLILGLIAQSKFLHTGTCNVHPHCDTAQLPTSHNGTKSLIWIFNWTYPMFNMWYETFVSSFFMHFRCDRRISVLTKVLCFSSQISMSAGHPIQLSNWKSMNYLTINLRFVAQILACSLCVCVISDITHQNWMFRFWVNTQVLHCSNHINCWETHRWCQTFWNGKHRAVKLQKFASIWLKIDMIIL